MERSPGQSPAWERTHDRLQVAALELFERQGFEATTVAQIARAANVTEMTFFRHFETKSGALVSDPYDEVIAEAVSLQPLELSALLRTVSGIRQAWRSVPEIDGDMVRRRVRILAVTPSLHGDVVEANAVTEALIANQLVRDGSSSLSARVAAAAALAALTAAIFEWAVEEDQRLSEVIELAMRVLEGSDG